MGSGAWRDWIALVTTNDSIATGYPIAPDRVLTAAHAVCSGGVEVRFFRRDRETSWPAQVVWPPEGANEDVLALDVAVLSLAEAIADCPLAPGPQLDLVSGGGWESEGFPAASFKKSAGGVSPEPLKGTLHSVATGDPALKLDLTSHPEKPEGWRGYSGAPVVSDRRLVGVLRRLPGGWEGRVEATAFSALWQASGFQDAIGDRGVRTVLDRFRAELRAELVRRLGPEWLRKAVAEELAGPLGSADEMAEILLSEPTLNVAVALRNVRYHLEAGDITGDPLAVEDLACAALPQLEEALTAVTDAIRGRETDSSLSLSIETPTVAELAMARLDGRPACYEVRGGEVVGVGLLDLPAETGISEQAFHRSFRESLAATLRLPTSQARPEPPEELDRKIQAQLRVLAHDRRPDRLSYYCVLTRDPGELTSVPENHHWIARTYPQLRLLRLIGRSDEELDLVVWLREIFLRVEDDNR